MIDDSALTKIADDQLGRADIVDRIAGHILRDRKPAGPKCGELVGLLGPWGSGKTTVLGFVREAIDSRMAYGAFKQVWVNLWMSEAAGNVLAAAIDELGKQIEPANKNGDFADKIGALGEILCTVGSVAGILNPLTGVAISSIGGLCGTEKHERERQKSLLTARDKYRELEGMILGDSGRLIIYMDDLDRCSPLQMIAAIEGARNLLAGERTTFIFAVDPELFGRALQCKYGNNFPNEDGVLYLEKILVPIFRLPEPSTNRLLWSQFRNELNWSEDLARMCAYNAEFAGITNPRVLKLAAFLLNSFWRSQASQVEPLVGKLGKPQLKGPSPDNAREYMAAAIFCLILLRQRHPLFYQRLCMASVRRWEFIRAAWEYWFARRAGDAGQIGKQTQKYVHVWGEDPAAAYQSGALSLLSGIHQRLCEAREGPATPETSTPRIASSDTPQQNATQPPQPDDGRFRGERHMIEVASHVFDLSLP